MIGVRRSDREAERAVWVCLVLALAAVVTCSTTGCTVISDQGVAVSTGPISDYWEVKWNPTLGTPSQMTNRSLQDVTVARSTPAIADTAGEAAVRAVFRQKAEWFQLRPGIDELVMVQNRAAEWLRYVRFQQMYRGIPVAGAGYEARVFPDGRVGSIEGRCYPNIELPVSPAVNEKLAESQANSLIVNGVMSPDVPSLRFDVERSLHSKRELAIVPGERGLILAWAILIENGPRERARVYINAETGKVIGRQPISGDWMR